MAQLVITVSFALFLLAFTAIGALSARRSQTSPSDYLVASRSVHPWLVALSAVSTNNSGYMFIGLIGFAWREGLSATWITLGWIVGDLLTWLWVHRRVREQSERLDVASVPALLSRSDRGPPQRAIAIAAGALTFFFLGGYAAAQLKAGGTTLHALFGWPIWVGAVIGVVIVTLYCMSGGLRASIWTDAAQSIVMLGAMSVLLIACVVEIGGPGELLASLRAIDPDLCELLPDGSPWSDAVFKALPGVAAPLLIYGIWRLVTATRATR